MKQTTDDGEGGKQTREDLVIVRVRTIQVLCPSQAVGVETANRDDGRPAAGDVSLSGGELCSKNYGQQIRRQEI